MSMVEFVRHGLDTCLQVAGLDASAHGGGPPFDTPRGLVQQTASELAARMSSSSSRGDDLGDMDDEADSAFVHQG